MVEWTNGVWPWPAATGQVTQNRSYRERPLSVRANEWTALLAELVAGRPRALAGASAGASAGWLSPDLTQCELFKAV